jgi:3-oxoacyl-[acyl-carrier protein] reductase
LGKLDGRVALVTGASRGIGAAIAAAFGPGPVDVLVNVSSQVGQKRMPNHTHYAAAKAGVIGFTRALAREAGPRGVHVNAIAPGPIETELIGPITDEFRREKSAIFALRRLGRPEEVAPTAVFLASADASYYTRQTLCLNGGDVMV